MKLSYTKLSDAPHESRVAHLAHAGAGLVADKRRGLQIKASPLVEPDMPLRHLCAPDHKFADRSKRHPTALLVTSVWTDHRGPSAAC